MANIYETRDAIDLRLDELEEDGEKISFIKYQFTDLEGNARELTITRESLKSDGREGTDGSSVFGKIIPPTESQMLLLPDWGTLTRIPWKPNNARVICDVYHPVKKKGQQPKRFEGCSRGLLAQIESNLKKRLSAKIGRLFPGKKISKIDAHFSPELEFILVNSSYPVESMHLDQGLRNNNYFIPPEEIVDNVLQELITYLGDIKLKREKYHTEVATYQYEIGIGHGNVLSMADATFTAKYLIDKIAKRHGMIASFIPKFRKEVNGNGMHVHINIAYKESVNGKHINAFYDPKKKYALSDIGASFGEGLLAHANEITALTNPLPISYKRLVPGCEAPTYISWDDENRTTLCRLHDANSEKVRLEYRAPDPTANPYLAFSAMLSAGLEGIENGLKLRPPEENRDLYHDNIGVGRLPGNLEEALFAMNGSKMLRKRMGSFMVDTVCKLGFHMWDEYSQEVTDADIRRFF
ncbi:glutamine synthetase family protein [Spirochaetota bacterium]